MPQQRGLILIHPYDDPLIIAGQGTIGLEMLEGRAGARYHWWCRSAAAG